MPKYNFTCEKCGKSKQAFTSVQTSSITCECGSNMARQFPNVGVQRVTETVNTYTNTRQDQDNKELSKKRRDDHYWNVEVPRLIETHSLETCLEQGWLVYNEKRELVINRPPDKR